MQVLTLKCRKCGQHIMQDVLCPECLQHGYKLVGTRLLKLNSVVILFACIMLVCHYLGLLII